MWRGNCLQNSRIRFDSETRLYDIVAQLALEHITFNDGVLGSNPSGVTNGTVTKMVKVLV